MWELEHCVSWYEIYFKQFLSTSNPVCVHSVRFFENSSNAFKKPAQKFYSRPTRLSRSKARSTRLSRSKARSKSPFENPVRKLRSAAELIFLTELS